MAAKVTKFIKKYPYWTGGSAAGLVSMGGAGYIAKNQEKLVPLSENKKDVISGAVSGLLAGGVTHPLDTLVIRKQVGGKHLFSGIGGKLAKTIPAGLVGYTAYGGTRRALENWEERVLEKNSELYLAPRYAIEKLTKRASLLTAPLRIGQAVTRFVKGLGGAHSLKAYKQPATLAGGITSIGGHATMRNPGANSPLSLANKRTQINTDFGISTARTNTIG